MKKAKQQILYALIGASGGLAGMVPLSRCGGNCAACFGCAGVGLGIVLILIGQKLKIPRGKPRGMRSLSRFNGVKEGSDGMG